MALLIRSGTLVTASDTFKADILVEGEQIVQIGADLDVPESAEIIDASGKLVLPGGVDAHTHFDLPSGTTVSSDDHYTGHKAAAFGGTTTAIDFINQDLKPLKANVDAWHAKADHKVAVDFSFHMNISNLDDQVEKEIPTLVNEGITSLKTFMAYKNLRLSDGQIFRILRIAGENGFLTMLHAEDGDVIDILVPEALAAGHKSPEWHALTRPAWGAVDATMRGAALAAQAKAPIYIVHMNAGGEADQLQYAREKGVPIMGETCPQYLFFTIDNLRRPDGAKWVCSPPVRSKEDNARLWKALSEGTIQTVATDHCAFFENGRKTIMYEGKPIAIPGKELGADDFSKIPNGLPGVGDRMPVLWTSGVGTKRITPNQFVALTCTNPAKIFGLYPRKGTLMPGADADIAIWDPERKLTYGIAYAQHRTDYNLYEGWELVGYPEKVFLRGNLIVDGNQWFGRPGMGRYIFQKPFAPVL
ncbi:MAG TPA: dihydropyrimidinase [Anaerolineaceae bacterium]|nr:dihydropyrimidinase [Anaerolineaceae bacterium]